MATSPQLLIDLGQNLSMMINLLAIPLWDTANRPKNARVGTFGFNLQTECLEYWDGSSWFAAKMSNN